MEKLQQIALLKNAMPINEFVELFDICKALGVDNRTARALISELATTEPVISLSSCKGYMRLGTVREDERQKVNDMVLHQIRDYASRIAVLRRRMKVLSEYESKTI